MVTIVVCWSLLLFCGYGLVSPVNATVIATLALGSLAVASAIFLIVELSQPYSGLFRISALWIDANHRGARFLGKGVRS